MYCMYCMSSKLMRNFMSYLVAIPIYGALSATLEAIYLPRHLICWLCYEATVRCLPFFCRSIHDLPYQVGVHVLVITRKRFFFTKNAWWSTQNGWKVISSNVLQMCILYANSGYCEATVPCTSSYWMNEVSACASIYLNGYSLSNRDIIKYWGRVRSGDVSAPSWRQSVNSK